MLIVLHILILISCLLISNSAFSQTQPQAPQVQTEQKAKSAIKSKEDPKPEPSHTCESSSPLPIAVTCIQAEPPQPQREKSSEEGTEYWPPFFGVRVKITDSLLALFTGFLWWATWRLVRGANKTAKHELRAYMGVERIRIQEESFGAGPPGQWSIKIRNFGKTMAKDTEVWIGGALVSVGNFDFPLGERRSKTVVMPQEAMVFEEIIGKKRVDIELFRLGTASIYAWGKITYKDVFDKPHWTIFRFKTYQEGPAEGGIRVWKVRTDGEGANDAD